MLFLEQWILYLARRKHVVLYTILLFWFQVQCILYLSSPKVHDINLTPQGFGAKLRKLVFHLHQAPLQTFPHSSVACGESLNILEQLNKPILMNCNLVREETHACVALGDCQHAASPLSSVALSFPPASCPWCSGLHPYSPAIGIRENKVNMHIRRQQMGELKTLISLKDQNI